MEKRLMIQKWRPLLRSLLSSLNETRPSSSSFHPRLIFADKLKPPDSDFLTFSPCPNQKRPLLRSHSTFRSHIPSAARLSCPFHHATISTSSPLPNIARPRHFPPFNPSSQILNSQNTIRCYQCAERGHIARFCKSSVRCFSCGALGHKRSRCRLSFKPMPEQRSSPTVLSRGDDVPWMLGNGWSEPIKSSDPLLLDPDIATCLDIERCDRISIQSVPGSGSQRLDTSMVRLEQVDEVKGPLLEALRGQTPIPRGLKPKSYISFTGRCSKGVKRHRLLGKGKGFGFAARPRLMFGMVDPVGSVEAIKSMADPCSGSRQLASEAVKTPNLARDHEDSIIVEESLSSDEDLSSYPQRVSASSSSCKQVELDLAPIRLEDFQVFEIFDDFEDCCSDDDPALKPSSSVIENSYANHPEDNYPLKLNAIPKISLTSSLFCLCPSFSKPYSYLPVV